VCLDDGLQEIIWKGKDVVRWFYLLDFVDEIHTWTRDTLGIRESAFIPRIMLRVGGNNM